MAFKKSEKTGSCTKNRSGKVHYKQQSLSRRPRRGSGMKCIKCMDTDPIMYKRVKNEVAEVFVSENGWEYCSKREYKDRLND